MASAVIGILDLSRIGQFIKIVLLLIFVPVRLARERSKSHACMDCKFLEEVVEVGSIIQARCQTRVTVVISQFRT